MNVWQRDVDEEAASRRWSQFLKWYVAPSAAIGVVALVLGGPWALLGVFILLGSIGALLAFGILLYNKGLSANRSIDLIDSNLVFGKVIVAVSDIELWTTHKSTRVDSTGAPATQAIFRVAIMRDGARGVRPDGGPAFDLVRFAWPEMTTPELDGVRQALARHVPAPWVELEGLSA